MAENQNTEKKRGILERVRERFFRPEFNTDHLLTELEADYPVALSDDFLITMDEISDRIEDLGKRAANDTDGRIFDEVLKIDASVNAALESEYERLNDAYMEMFQGKFNELPVQIINDISRLRLYLAAEKAEIDRCETARKYYTGEISVMTYLQSKRRNRAVLRDVREKQKAAENAQGEAAQEGGEDT